MYNLPCVLVVLLKTFPNAFLALLWLKYITVFPGCGGQGVCSGHVLVLVLEPKEMSYQSVTLVLGGKQLKNRSLSSHHLCKPAGDSLIPKTLDLALSDPRKLSTKEILLKIISQFNNHLSSKILYQVSYQGSPIFNKVADKKQGGKSLSG